MNLLNADIQTLLTNVRGQIPPPVFAQLEAVVSRLEAAKIGVHAPQAGDPVPTVSFVDADSKTININELFADQPLILLFYRGGWCPFCDLTLRAFDKIHEQIEAAGARLVAVSPQTVAETKNTGSSRALSFELASDPHNAAAKSFGVAWTLTEPERELYKAFNSDLERYNNDQDWELPAPAVFIINQQGTVVWSKVNPDYTTRAEPAEVLAALKSV